MPLADLLSPICAATIVNVFLFAILWRGDWLEVRNGKTPWKYGLGVVLYGGVILTAFLSARSGPVTDKITLFTVAAGAEALGVVIAWVMHGALIGSRGRPPKDRALAMAFSFVLAGGVFGALFTR